MTTVMSRRPVVAPLVAALLLVGGLAACSSASPSASAGASPAGTPSGPARPVPALGPTDVARPDDPDATRVPARNSYLRYNADKVVDLPAGTACEKLNDPGWSVTQCRLVTDRLAYVVEKRQVGQSVGWRANIVVLTNSFGWWTVQGYADDTGREVSSIGLQTVDLSGDGTPEGVFGYHLKSSELAYDIAEQDLVWGHRGTLNDAAVQVSPYGIAEVSRSADGAGFQLVQITGAKGVLIARATQRYATGSQPNAGNL